MNKLKFLRDRNNLTQLDVSMQSGVNNTFIQILGGK